MKRLYRIVRFDRNKNKEILSGGVSRKVAEYALDLYGMHNKFIRWNNNPIGIEDGMEIYEGELINEDRNSR